MAALRRFDTGGQRGDPQDDDTTENQGEDAAEAASNAQADAAQTTSDPRGKARANQVLNQFDALNSGKDPAQASLLAQYGLNAQQARAILQRARDTLAQNAPGLENIAAAQRMSPSWTPGGFYASALGAASDKQQQVLGQLLQYDEQMAQTDQGGLNAQLALLKQRYADEAKVAPAAMRVLGLPDQPKAPNDPIHTALVGQGVTDFQNDPRVAAAYKAYQAKLTHFADPVANQQATASLITPDAKELAYQYFKQNNALPPGFSRNPTMVANMLNYVAQRAAQDGESEVSILANTQANKAAQAVVKDFSSANGKAGASLNAINTAVLHMDSLGPLVDQLGNTDSPAFNKLAQAFKQQTGSPAPTNYDAIKEFVGGEVAKAVLPSGGGELERRALTDVLNKANSPEQLKGAIQNIQTALAGKTEALRTQWDAATHGTQGDFSKFLGPTTKRVLGVQDTSANNAPVKVNSPEEARKLAPGTKFMTPDGRLLVR